MLTIHMKSGGRRDPVVSQLSLTELFRTLRVVGEVPFIEPSAGTLLNLTRVERIYDDTVDEESELTTSEAVAALEDEQADVTVCPHGYLRYTCSICTPAFTGIPQYRGKP